jgi:hypothetical protein
MSYKQRALAAMAQLGATQSDSYYDERDRVWRVDYSLPKGKVWARHGEHASHTLELTLADCWKDLIDLARGGVEACADTCDCRHWADDDIEPACLHDAQHGWMAKAKYPHCMLCGAELKDGDLHNQYGDFATFHAAMNERRAQQGLPIH